MTSSLSNLVNNLSEGIHKIKCKFGHDDKKWETCGITYEVCDCFLEYTSFKDDLIEYKCLCHKVLIYKGESTGLKHFNDSKAFIEYSNGMDDIYKTLKNTI